MMTDKDKFLKEYKEICAKYEMAVGLNVVTNEFDYVTLEDGYCDIDNFLDCIIFEVQRFDEFTGDARLHYTEE